MKASKKSTTVAGKKSLDEMSTILKRMCDFMDKFQEKMQKYYFLAAYSQLTSRICHSHPEVWRVLRIILLNVFLEFPHHSFWQLVSLVKSSYSTRASRAKEILEAAKSMNPKLTNFINDAYKLSDQCVKLSDEKSSTGKRDSLKRLSPAMYKHLTSGTIAPIMLPTTRNMTLTLPSSEIVASGVTSGGSGASAYNPFRELVYINGVEDEVLVMESLVKPKKIEFRGSDGKRYPFLAKPKDDLRRDSRLVDFNNLINKLFIRDPEARKRNLRVRTYTAIPLNETNGIIEWINNLQSLRSIILTGLKNKVESIAQFSE